MKRLAVITSHPIQYYAPWFRHIARHGDVKLRVFYLWDFGVRKSHDEGFGEAFEWDVPLLGGYEHEFVPNASVRPGTGSFGGLDNPQLAERVKTWKPDTTLLMLYNYRSIIRFMVRRDKTVPLLFRGDSHRLFPSKGPVASLKGMAIRRFFSKMKACLYVGKANRDYYRLHGVPEEDLFFSPHAIDNTRFLNATREAGRGGAAWRADLGIPPDHTVVLFAGKFVPKKRPIDLLEAFLRLDRDNCSLLFVGGGELEGEMKSRAGGSSHVFFAPFQNQSMMPRTYAAGDLFVLPSHGPSETWGLAVNEAMCLERPVLVSTHVGCSRDLVRNNGLVFEAGNMDSLVTSLEEALSSNERLKQWGKRSREIVADYSYERATEGLARALEYSLA